MVDNEVDICTYGFVATPERVQLMDFSIVAEIDNFRFIMRYPDAKSRLLGPVRPFQPIVIFLSDLLKHYLTIISNKVWGLFLITVIAVMIFATLVMIFNEKMAIEVIGSGRTWLGHFGSIVVYVISIIASQGNFISEFQTPNCSFGFRFTFRGISAK